MRPVIGALALAPCPEPLPPPQEMVCTRLSAHEEAPALDNGDGASASAAKHTVQAVQQFVAMLQIQMVRPPPHPPSPKT